MTAQKNVRANFWENNNSAYIKVAISYLSFIIYQFSMLTIPSFIVYLQGWPNDCKWNHFKNQSKKQTVTQLINVTLNFTSKFILPS